MAQAVLGGGYALATWYAIAVALGVLPVPSW
jgi:hypothetical protein